MFATKTENDAYERSTQTACMETSLINSYDGHRRHHAQTIQFVNKSRLQHSVQQRRT